MVITYNHARYIAQALESVLMQKTDFDFEINVIEDCSTDGTQEIVMRYVRKYPHIVKPHFNAKNIGFKVTQKNFYRGFRTLTGDYLAILEGDDYWTSPDKLQKQVDFLDAHPDFAICAHNTLKVHEDGSAEPERFLYRWQRGDATVEDAICLRTFFHTTGVLYRNVFHGIPPRHYRNKWSCDIFILISHATRGKIHHIDEDMAVYRVHPGGRFSGMRILDSWMFNIDGLRRYNAWLGFRFMRSFAEAISNYCRHVLQSHGKGGAPALTLWQHAKIVALWTFYRAIYRLLTIRKLFDRPTPLVELPPLEEPARWDLTWGLGVESFGHERVVANHPVLRLTALYTNDTQAQHRHAISERIGGLAAGSTYRVSAWVKSVDGTHVQLQLRDSVNPETGRPGHEGEVRYSLLTSAVMTIDGGLRSAGVTIERNGWQRVWADITTDDGTIFVLLGLLRKSDNTHAFEGNGEQLLFGGIDLSDASASAPTVTP